MNESLLNRFIELVKHDQRINLLERDIDKIQDDVAYHEEEGRKLQENLEVAERHKHDMHKLVDQKEFHMKELDEQEREAKRRLDTVKNSREFDSIQREVVSLQKEQHVFEQELLDIWKSYEDAQRACAEKRVVTQENITKNEALIYEKTQKIVELEEQVKQLYDSRPEKTRGISDEMLEKYALMRTQIPNPVVPIDRGSCSACFNTVPEQEMMSIKRGALRQCKMCFRFLYSEL